jgi:hypothetical protein
MGEMPGSNLRPCADRQWDDSETAAVLQEFNRFVASYTE